MLISSARHGSASDAWSDHVRRDIFNPNIDNLMAHLHIPVASCAAEYHVSIKKEAAVVPFGALTSLHFLRKGNIRRGQHVLVYGASGSPGVAAVQLAKHFGAEVTGICSTRHMELVTSLGADSVIDYTKEDFTKSDAIYDVIYDTVGKCPYSGALRKLKKKGIFLRAVQKPPISSGKALWTNMTTNKKVIGGISIEHKEDLVFLKELIEAGD